MRRRFPLSLPRLLLLGAVVGAVSLGISKGAEFVLQARGGRSPWTYRMVANVIDWTVWAALVPLVVAFSNYVPLSGLRRRRAVVAHFGAGMLFILAHTLICAGLWLLNAKAFGTDTTFKFLVSVTLMTTADWAFAVYWGIVALSHALHYRDQVHERELRAVQLEANLAEAQLQALQRQLHPHFLFNTLHAIFTLVREDPRAAEEMIDRLSEMLRVTLAHTAAQQVPLQTELTFLNKYLAIQKVLLGDRLTVRMDVPLAARDAAVPYLMLQPLAENAIRHGIEPCAKSGQVTIAARRVGDDLELTVADNGRGLAPGRLLDFNEGVGLSNTRARLERLYPGRHELLFRETPGGGLTVVLRVPYSPLELEGVA